MADLTQAAYLKIWGEATTDRWILTTSSAQTPYKGQPMYLDITADTIYVLGFLDAQTVAATDIFIGIAAEDIPTVASGATEDTEVTSIHGTDNRRLSRRGIYRCRCGRHGVYERQRDIERDRWR